MHRTYLRLRELKEMDKFRIKKLINGIEYISSIIFIKTNDETDSDIRCINTNDGYCYQLPKLTEVVKEN